MQAETARKLVQDQLESLSSALQSGHSEQLQSYLGAIAKFHKYSMSNVFLILLQNPDATHVAGYHTWRSLGRQVKEGEKGIAIIAPMRLGKKDGEQAQTAAKDEDVVRFRTAYVFDISQTDGEPLPSIGTTTGEPGEFSDRLKGLVQSLEIELEFGDLGGPLGVSSGGRIKIQSGLSEAQEFSVLVHELAHELLHQKRRDPSLSKTIKETQAEAVAYIVAQGIGLDAGTSAADYIQLYQGDAKSLLDSLDEIRKASTEILSALMPGDE
jgi:antirestriction protein ArdC